MRYIYDSQTEDIAGIESVTVTTDPATLRKAAGLLFYFALNTSPEYFADIDSLPPDFQDEVNAVMEVATQLLDF